MKPDYSFQKKCVERSVDMLKEHSRCLLACAPASGKTEMAISIIGKMRVKTIISAHGTLVLSKQFSDRIKDYNKGKLPNIQVTIPQALS